MQIQFDQLACASLFSRLGDVENESRLLVAGRDGGRDIRLVESKDVVFLPSVLETGQSLCLIDGVLVPEEAYLNCWNLDFFKAQSRAHPEFQKKYAGSFEVECHGEPVCILSNLFSKNFGHWTEELLKVAVLETANIQCRYVIADLPDFAAKSLDFLGVTPDRILSVSKPTLFSRALFSTAVSQDNIVQFPSALEILRDLVDHRLGDKRSAYGDRLWLERKSAMLNGGIVLNMEQTRELLVANDFRFLDMAELSIADQFAAVRGARVIAGAHGAQFAHCQFLPRKSTVIECFSPVHVNPSVLEYCRVLGHRYYQIVSRAHLIAPYEHGRDCEVDCEHLSLVLSYLSD